MTSDWVRSIALAVFAAAPSLEANAQQTGLQVHTGEIRFDGQPARSALTFAPEFTGRGVGLRVSSAGQFSLANTGQTQSELLTSVSSRRPLFLGISPLLTLRGNDDALASQERNRRVDGVVGVSVGTTRLGATAGVGLGRSVHGGTSRDVQTASASVHVARGPFQLRLGYAGNAFDSPEIMSNQSSGFSLTRTRLSDVTSNASWRFRRIEFGGFVGRRIGGDDAHSRGWGGAFANLELNDRIALVARQETAPSDPTRHLASQRIATIGFRIRPALSRARFDDGTDAATLRREFAVFRLAGHSHGVRVYMPGAATVELAGSFTSWVPVLMRRGAGGWWEFVTTIPSGLHSLNIRTDGGSWRVPPGLDIADDEFNGTVGLLLIP